MLNSKYSKVGIFSTLVTLLCIIILTGCGQKASYEKKSALDIFGYTTIYFSNTKKEALETLGTQSVYLDIKHSEEQLDVLNNRVCDSIRELGGLNIVVDNNNKLMFVSSDIEGKTLEVYNTIMTELTTNKTRYLTLYRSLEFDSEGNISNITFDETEGKIRFNFSRTGGYVDTRFLDIPIKTRDDITGEDVSSLDNSFKLLSSVEGSWEYLIFKNDAIYGTACSELGQNLMKAVKQLEDKQLIIEESGNVYMGTSMELMLNSVADGKPVEESVKKLNTSLIKAAKSEDFENEVKIYYEEDSKYYRDDLNSIFKSLGYTVTETDNLEGCDLIVGYTWLYNNSLQSSFDDTLNEAIMSHVNGSGIETNTEFIVRSSWILGR